MAQRRRFNQGPQRCPLLRTQTVGNLREAMMDSEVVPSPLVEIALILRVANVVEGSNPRIAYLCMSGLVFYFVVNWIEGRGKLSHASFSSSMRSPALSTPSRHQQESYGDGRRTSSHN
ncbi:hypothetical protein ACFE04_028806 [Oxalis oulophora]